MNSGHEDGLVALSFGVAFVGSYLAISVCEQYRQLRTGYVESRHLPMSSYLGLMVMCIGVVRMWCMHLIGMSAVKLFDEDGEKVEIRYDIGLTVLSVILVVALTSTGFYIGSLDRIFSKTKRQIVELLIADASSLSMHEAKNLTEAQIFRIMSTYYPQHLICGALFSGSGAIVMHYVGAAAMRFPGRISWNSGYIAATVIIALLACQFAFWLLFRLLSMYPNKEDLRLTCSLTMALAMGAVHYIGMMALKFELDPTVQVSAASTMSSQDLFLTGILLAAVLSLAVMIISLSDLRYSVSKLVVELCRADDAMMGLPPSVAAHTRKYIKNRKASKFNLGVVNKTMEFEDDHEGSVSDDGNSPQRFVAGTPVNANKVHPLTQANLQSLASCEMDLESTMMNSFSQAANQDDTQEQSISLASLTR